MMRLMPRLCYQCFAMHRDSKLVIEEATRLMKRGPLKKRKPAKHRPLSMRRKRDLLLLMSGEIERLYGVGFDNREMGNRTGHMTTTALFWKASATLRHLRKKFRIKGEVCRELQGNDYDIFVGYKVAEVERDYLNFLCIPESHWSRYFQPFGYVWEANVGGLLFENRKRRLLRMDVPLDIRLKHYKLYKHRDRYEREAWEAHRKALVDLEIQIMHERNAEERKVRVET